MVALTVTEAYTTISQADIYLENNAAWSGATDEAKTTALLYGRYYLDENFSCIDLTDEVAVPDSMQYANAILAADYVSDGTIFESGANVKLERVKADVVETETEYFGGKTNKPPSLALVKGILKGVCTYSKTTPFLIRG